MPTVVSRTELAAFLRSRRERVRPEEVGLPAAGRRRTPGLRREEVAQLARVGVTWYTWLEQARPINASPGVLEAIAGALRLDAGETAHLFTLAGIAAPATADSIAQLDPATRRIMDALDPMPACLTDARHNVIAQNRASELIMGSIRGLPPARRNNLWLIYTEPTWRRLMIEWEQESAYLIAIYRAAMAEHLDDPSWQGVVDELSEVSEDFRTAWAEHQVALPGGRTKTFEHPSAGLLRFRTTSQWLQPRTGTRMIIYCPADAATERSVTRWTQSGATPFEEWSDLARYGSSARVPIGRAG